MRLMADVSELLVSILQYMRRLEAIAIVVIKSNVSKGAVQ